MLDTSFTEFLNTNFPMEYVNLVNSCRDSLYNYGFSLVEANLYKTTPDTTEFDLLTSKLLFTQCIIDGYHSLFMMFGIRTSLRDLQELDKILRAIKNLEESSDSETILEIINDDEYSQSETLEKLLDMGSAGMNMDEVLFSIELIKGNDFFNRLQVHHQHLFINQMGEASDERPDRVYLDKVRDYASKFPETILARKLMSKDILFGETYQHYIAENKPELDLLYPTSIDKVASEFVGLAIIANVQRHDLSGHVKTAITKFYGDLRFTTKTNYLVDKFIEGLEYEHQSTSMV